MRWATFVSHHGAEIQLMQPAPGTPLFAASRSTAKASTTSAYDDDPGAVARRLAEEGLNHRPRVIGDPDTRGSAGRG